MQVFATLKTYGQQSLQKPLQLINTDRVAEIGAKTSDCKHRDRRDNAAHVI